MTALFLHGGGDHPDGRGPTLGRFVAAAAAGGPGRLALISAAATADEAHRDGLEYQAIFAELGGAGELHLLVATPEAPLQRAALEALAPTGVFVCGGATPLYHQALCADAGWLAYLREAGLPYAGTSAGAAIAAGPAVLGGWRAARAGAERAILFRGAGEGLDPLTVRPGLGLAPFAVDVHASQMGTLTRLLHAVELGLADEGWAIDENTMLLVEGGRAGVYGLGQAYHMRRGPDGSVAVTIHAGRD